MAGGGPNTTPAGSLLPLQTVQGTNGTTGVVSYKILGSEPNASDSPKTPFKPDVPCENQQPPNLGTSTRAAPPQTLFRGDSSAAADFRNSPAGKLSIEGARTSALAIKTRQAAGSA